LEEGAAQETEQLEAAVEPDFSGGSAEGMAMEDDDAFAFAAGELVEAFAKIDFF
jgi:hypothetical protein